MQVIPLANADARGTRLTMVVAAGALIMSVGLGIRQTFGLFLAPISGSHAASLALIALALALQNLVWGFTQPIVGSLSDRYGPPVIVAGGALLYAAGLALVAIHPSIFTVVFGFGLLVGLAQSGTTFAVVMSAVSRAATDKQRATATALAAAAGSLGQVGLIPLAQTAISLSGFQRGLIVLAAFALIALPAGLWLKGRPNAPRPQVGNTSSLAAILVALRDRNYVFLTVGFFACGFQLAFVAIHLPTYLSLCHIPASIGASALALIGFFNIIGTFGFGKLMDRFPAQNLLAVLYVIRSTAIAVFVAVPPTAATTLAFASVMGLAWLGTVPLTNGIIARMYGIGNLGALFGACFLAHQVGSFLGAWLGGVTLQQTGSYQIMWAALIAVGYASALINLPIRVPSAAPVPV
ncbi:MAG: MFS transporter [Vulcanimicrobiaceae bacterium]